MARRSTSGRLINIELLGEPELQAKLDALEFKVQRKVIRKAIRAGGRSVLEAARANVPIDTGALKAGLKLRAIKRTRTGFGVYIRTPTRAELAIDENDPGYYPAVLEYGADGHRPQPFLRPAMDANRDKAKARIVEELRKGITGIIR